MNLDGLGYLEPSLVLREAQRGHRVVADTGAERADRTVDRRVRIAADDDHAGRDESRFHDDVMQTTAPAVEDVLYFVLLREPAHGRQRLRCFARCRGEVVIEGERELVRI